MLIQNRNMLAFVFAGINGVLLLEFSHYLTGFRESSYLELRENQLAIRDNIKDTIVPRDQLCLHV